MAQHKTYPHRAAQKLVAYRKARRWSQEQLAAHLGKSRMTVARLETGMRLATAEQQRQMLDAGICEPGDWFVPAEPEQADAA